MLIKYYSVQENKTPCHTPLSPSGPFSYVWKGVKCYIDTNILSASTHTPTELKTMFKDQLALLSQELKTFHQYKLLTQKATKSIEEQYEHLFFYQGYTYQKAQLLQETQKLYQSTTTYINPTEPTPINLSTEDVLSSFIFNASPLNSTIKQIGISTQSIRNLT